MIKVLLLLLFALPALGKPIVLLGHFDPFGRAPFNNSEKVAKLLREEVKNHPDFELRLCELPTIFDKSVYQLEDCMKALPREPQFVLGLGEASCNFKVETIVRNLDLTRGADNDGNERRNTVIIPEADAYLGLRYPLSDMYCSLPAKDRKTLEVSNSAGSFVCNNLAFQMAHLYPELNFGFIHVPAHNCRDLESKNQFAVRALSEMITAAVKAKGFERHFTTKKDIRILRQRYQNDACLGEFYKRTKGIDEKGLWTF